MKYLLVILFIFSLYSCWSSNTQQTSSWTQETNTKQEESKAVLQTIYEKNNLYKIVIPSDYKTNSVESVAQLSYWSDKKNTYVMVLSESKAVLDIKNLDWYFEAISPKFNNKVVEKLPVWTIKNTKNYKVQDYRITGDYSWVKVVWFTRIIDTGTHFVQINSWTVPTLEEENKDEVFNNIDWFEWFGEKAKDKTEKK